MAKLSRDQVLKLAQLSSLELSDEEVEHFRSELQQVLSYVEQLQEVDLEDVAPTNQVTGLYNVVRQDEVKDYGPTPDELLENAPQKDGRYIKVRRVL